jgi:hypothetical protein
MWLEAGAKLTMRIEHGYVPAFHLLVFKMLQFGDVVIDCNVGVLCYVMSEGLHPLRVSEVLRGDYSVSFRGYTLVYIF